MQVVTTSAEPRVFSDLCRALAQNTSTAECAQVCADVVAKQLPADIVQIWILTADQTALELSAAAGKSASLAACQNSVRLETFGIGRIARDCRPYFTNSVSDDPYLSVQAGASQDDVVAFAGYPLVVADRLLGVLSLYFRTALADDFVSTTAWLADLVAMGIESKLATESLRETKVQLQQSQKLAMLGRLVAGVAHDFNNLVTVLRGYGEMVASAAGRNGQLRKDAEEIQKAAQRAATLTRQILGFGRVQPIQRQPLDLNAIVADLMTMLRRLIREDIGIGTSLEPELPSVQVDAGQIEQVIMNLVLNARDAMPHGGRLLIETTTLDLAEGQANNAGKSPAGRCVVLSVSDTGCGIDAQDLPHIFKPFFSTKEPDRGTGLGLATVQEIIEQNGGSIAVSSQPGRGTTFKITFPRAEETAHSIYLSGQRSTSRPGTETILLAEEDEQVRSCVRDALCNAGYTVLEASDGADLPPEAIARIDSIIEAA